MRAVTPAIASMDRIRDCLDGNFVSMWVFLTCHWSTYSSANGINAECTECVLYQQVCSNDGAHRNSAVTLTKIHHPCGTANEGGSPTKLVVS
ncbi:hypothetical protein, partial [Rhodococcus sp. 14-2470-1a]|uniref:hypothetical protein n=1 Tax=Rhodococcus sp. 14-2470-1a TaxID=2023150 RepID=UPI001C52A92C